MRQSVASIRCDNGHGWPCGSTDIEKGTVSHINASYTHCYTLGFLILYRVLHNIIIAVVIHMFLTHRHRLLMFVRNCSGQFLVLHRPTYDRPQPATLFEQGDWVVTLASKSQDCGKKRCIHVYKWVYNMQLPEALRGMILQVYPQKAICWER